MYREVFLHQVVQGLDDPGRQQEVGEEMDVGNWTPTDEYKGPYDEEDQDDDDDK